MKRMIWIGFFDRINRIIRIRYSTRFRIVTVLATAWAATVVPAIGADLYVSTNGNNSTYTNWSTAYTNIQAALNAATNGVTIYLAGHAFLLPWKIALWPII